MEQTNEQVKVSLIPPEFLEPNWRLWSFVVLIGLVLAALLAFPVKPFDGYVDPFYSPTVLILPFIGMFRLTCYAFRKYYHRHLFEHPLACGINIRADSAKRTYGGETGLFRIENLHRYFMYLGVLVLPFFFYDFYTSLLITNGMVFRVGSLLLLADTLLVTAWVFSCHSVRHLIGGGMDCYSCAFAPKRRHGLYLLQSFMNEHHELLAWSSLILIVFVDLYLRALDAGWPIDATLLALRW